jgi:hypothetical protein
MGTSDVLTAEELAKIMVEYWWPGRRRRLRLMTAKRREAEFKKLDDIFLEVLRGVSRALIIEASALAHQSQRHDR